jgi:hypothetical protein
VWKIDIEGVFYGAIPKEGNGPLEQHWAQFVLLDCLSLRVDYTISPRTVVDARGIKDRMIVRGRIRAALLWRSVIVFQFHQLEIRPRSCFVCCMFHIEADVTWRFLHIVGQSSRRQASINLIIQALTEYEWLLDISPMGDRRLDLCFFQLRVLIG